MTNKTKVTNDALDTLKGSSAYIKLQIEIQNNAPLLKKYESVQLAENLSEFVWQTASQHYEREIAEWKSSAMFYSEKNDELIAQVNQLREALEKIADTDPDDEVHWFHNIANEALAATAPQSLQAFENEVIDLALDKLSQIKSPHNYTAAESHIYEQAHSDCWKAIRALKSK